VKQLDPALDALEAMGAHGAPFAGVAGRVAKLLCTDQRAWFGDSGDTASDVDRPPVPVAAAVERRPVGRPGPQLRKVRELLGVLHELECRAQ
jgi:hypothetical protein